MAAAQGRDSPAPASSGRTPRRTALSVLAGALAAPVVGAPTPGRAQPGTDWPSQPVRYVCEEVRAAIGMGVPVEGICLYPVLSHPGWDDGRYCPNGLFEMEARDGRRVEHAPLAAELRRQQHLLTAMRGEQAGKDRAEEADGP